MLDNAPYIENTVQIIELLAYKWWRSHSVKAKSRGCTQMVSMHWAKPYKKP